MQVNHYNYFNNTKLERLVNPQTQEETGYIVHYPDGAQAVLSLALGQHLTSRDSELVTSSIGTIVQ